METLWDLYSRHLLISISLIVLSSFAVTWVQISSIQRNPGKSGLRILQIFILPFLLMAVLVAMPRWARHQRHKRLQENGVTIDARITSIEERTNIRMNYRSPWVIRATWRQPGSGRDYFFTSSHMWFDPRPRVNSPTIQVRINPQNPSEYEVNVAPLYNQPAVEPYQQISGLKKEVEQLKKDVADLHAKKD